MEHRVRPRLLLILPSTTYRAAAFLDAARRMDIDLTVASDHRSTFAKDQPANVLYLDCDDPVAVAAQARRFAEAHRIDAVFGVDDLTAVAAAHAARALDLPHNSVEACDAARDKHRQRIVLARAGLPVPPFALHRFDGDLARQALLAPYPCVLKPTHLSMSRGVIRADDPDAFLRAAERLRAIVTRADSPAAGRDAFLVERFIPGDEFAVEGLMDRGQLRVLAVFDKPDPLDGPFFEETIYSTPSRLPDDAQLAITAVVEHAAQALGLTNGPVHAEVRLNYAGPWIIELAARPIGGRCSAVLRFGEKGEVSLEQLLLSHALGLAADAYRESPAAAVMMVPVPRAGRLVAVRGADEARRVPWIDDAVITVHPGQQLEPLPEGNHYLGFIYAWADDAGTAVAALREAHAKLTVELE